MNRFKMNMCNFLFATLALIIIVIAAVVYSVTVLNDKDSGTQVIVTSSFIVISYCFVSIIAFKGYWDRNGK